MVCLADRLCSLYDEAQRLKIFMRLKSNVSSTLNIPVKPEVSDTITETQNRSNEVELHSVEEISIDEDKVVDTVCDFLDREIAINENSIDQSSSEVITSFHGSPRSFTASYYIRRMIRYSGASASCLVVSLIYLDRLQAKISMLRLSSNTIQRLLLVVVMEATKFLEDIPRSNATW